MAVDRGHLLVAIELLARGAAVNAKSAPPSAGSSKKISIGFLEWFEPEVAAGITPLMVAVSNADLPMVELLVQSTLTKPIRTSRIHVFVMRTVMCISEYQSLKSEPSPRAPYNSILYTQ